MLARRLGLCAVLGWTLLAPAGALASWSKPRFVAGCSRASSQAAPLVVFPSSQPQVRSGPGALLWSGPGGCGGGAAGASGAETTQTYGARLGRDGLPGPGRALIGAGTAGKDPVEIAAVAGTALGQVIALGDGVLAEGSSPGAFAAPLALAGPAEPVAIASGYLGDVVTVSTLTRLAGRGGPRVPRGSRGRAGVRAGGSGERPQWELAVRVQRHYSAAPASPRLLAVGASRPSALAVAMDYRSDVLVVWTTADGSIDARELHADGAVGPPEQIAVGAGVVEPRVLISDDDRAIVAWREQTPAGGGRAVTSVEASISGAAMTFGGAGSVERFTDLPGLAPPPGSLRLTRLSSEAVMMAWTGMRGGRYVVRASPVSLRRGVWAPVTISPRGRQALLAGLVAGPHAEALALWTTAPRLDDGQLDRRRRAIFAAWGHYGGHGEARFAAPEALAPAGPNGIPGAAFDPQNDMALAAWVTGVRSLRVVYAQRAAGPPSATTARAAHSEGRHAARDVGLPALGLLLLAAAAAWHQRTEHRRAARPRRA